MDFCDLITRSRSWIFAKDRDVVLQTGRVFEGPGTIPIGGIVIWSGAIVDIPAGWSLCDGSGSTPDLRDRFIVGAGSTYAVDATGGLVTVDLQHDHGAGSYAAANEAHDHQAGTLSMGGPSTVNATDGNPGTIDATDTHIHSVVSGNFASDTHGHDVQGSSANALSTTEENRPPYYALAYIMRTT